jgi:ABC-type transport system substrate-binding protein
MTWDRAGRTTRDAVAAMAVAVCLDSKTNEITPSIATQLDPKTWKFAIRPGVTFSDGAPLTAADAAFSLNRILDKSFGSQQYANFSVVSQASAEGADLIVRTAVPSRPYSATSPRFPWSLRHT